MRTFWNVALSKFSVVFFLFLALACTQEDMNESAAQKYFQLQASGDYMETDSYLAKNFVYEDVIFKQEYTNKQEFVKSLAINPDIKYNCETILSIENTSVANDSMVYVKGQYCGYSYNNREIKPMRFLSVLYFDKKGKIKRQEDWKDHSLEGILSMYQFRASTIQQAE